jgi:uncharacterized delta-60 repeat protein
VTSMLLMPNQLLAAPSDLDANFGVGGVKIFDALGGDYYDQSPRAVRQPDGKTVVARTCVYGRYLSMCAVRLMASGEVDTSFGSSIGRSGQVFITPLVGEDYSGALALQRDGRILIAGACNTVSGYFRADLCIVRLLASGQLDTAFGQSGRTVIYSAPAYDWAGHVSELADGSLLIAGSCDVAENNGPIRRSCLAKLTAGGQLDSAFGGGGRVVLAATMRMDQAIFAGQLEDEKILVAGACEVSYRRRFCVARLRSDGSVDSTYGSSGLVTVPVSQNDYDNLYHALLLPDQRLLLAGMCGPYQGDNKLCVTRVNSDGSQDLSFGTQGSLVRRLGGGNLVDPVRMAVQPDGRILIGVTCDSASQAFAFCVTRLTRNGQPDGDFGVSGNAFYRIGGMDDRTTNLTLQENGAVVLVGKCNDGAGYKFCAAQIVGGRSDPRSCALNADLNNSVDASTDGLLTLRYLLGYRGSALTDGVLGSNPSRTGNALETWLASVNLDADGDGQALAMTDGLLVLRAMLGLSGPALTAGAVNTSFAITRDAQQILTWIESTHGLACLP